MMARFPARIFQPWIIDESTYKHRGYLHNCIISNNDIFIKFLHFTLLLRGIIKEVKEVKFIKITCDNNDGIITCDDYTRVILIIINNVILVNY